MYQYIIKQEQYGIKGDQLYGQKALYYFCMELEELIRHDYDENFIVPSSYERQ